LRSNEKWSIRGVGGALGEILGELGLAYLGSAVVPQREPAP